VYQDRDWEKQVPWLVTYGLLTLEQVDVGKNFLNRAPKAQQLRERTDKWEKGLVNGTVSN
jgi:hypothetical protein